MVLYELLTGALPFDSRELRQAANEEILRTIRDEEPPRPSTRLSSLGDEAENAAKNRRTAVRTLTKRLHHELEWIPLKAIRKEPDRRYRTAMEFADDIHNYLNGKPLIAGPESMSYRVKKLMARHYAASAISGLLLIIITSTSFISLYSYNRARLANINLQHSNRRNMQANHRNLALANQALLLLFLEYWQDGKTQLARGFASSFAKDSREELAVKFLLDLRPIAEKESDYQKKFSNEQASFWQFVLAEHFLKDGNELEAIKCYKICLDIDTTSEIFDLYKSRAKIKCDEFLAKNKQLLSNPKNQAE